MTIRAKNEDWLKNPPIISREETEEAFATAAVEISEAVNLAIKKIGVVAVDIDKFIEDVVQEAKKFLTV